MKAKIENFILNFFSDESEKFLGKVFGTIIVIIIVTLIVANVIR